MKMILLKTYQRKLVVTIWFALLLMLTIACAPDATLPSATAPTMPSPSVATTTPCEQQLVPPVILEVQPAEPVAGSEIAVIGSGGYIEDSCGGYIEGSRIFKLYLDNEPVGNFSCYVNRCEAKVMLPATLSAGTHCLSTELDQCQFEFQVTIP